MRPQLSEWEKIWSAMSRIDMLCGNIALMASEMHENSKILAFADKPTFLIDKVGFSLMT